MSHFENLSDKILLKIFYDRCISEEDLISLSNVSERFHNVCCSETNLWKSKFIQRWPLVWEKINSGRRNSTSVENWKSNVEVSVKVRNEIEKIMRTISYHSYKHKSIPSKILSSFYELLDYGKFAYFIALDELRSKTTDLTHQHYANQLFYHVQYYLSSKGIKEFLHLPHERQSLEKGVYYVAKGIYPENFLETDYDEVSFNLDKLALKVQSYLRTQNSNHPAASIELFSPEDPIENSKWSNEETIELIECLSHILCSTHTFRNNADMRSVFSEKIEGKKLNENRILFELQKINYFSVIFIGVSHRLGLRLQIFDDLDSSLFIWKPSDTDKFEVFTPYVARNWNNIGKVDELTLSHRICSTKEAMQFLVRSSLRTISSNVKNNEFLPEKIGTLGIILFLYNHLINDLDNICSDVFRICLKHELFLEVIIEICQKFISKFIKNELTILNEVEKLGDAYISNGNAEDLLNVQRDRRKRKPKNRVKESDVKFATGMIVTYKDDLRPGVIFGWDKNCDPRRGLTEKYKRSSLQYKLDQPYYWVLFSNDEPHYAPQEALSVTKESSPVMHFEVGKYFKRFNGTFYEPNQELCAEYPDDETVRNEFYG